MDKEKAKRQILLMMVERLANKRDFEIKTKSGIKRVPVQFTPGGLPYYKLKNGKLMLQNPNKGTIWARFAQKGIPVGWLIPPKGGKWELVTPNRFLNTYRMSDANTKRQLTRSLNERLKQATSK